MNANSLDIRLLRFRSRREEPAHALAQALLEAGRFAESLEVVQLGQIDAENDPRLLVLEGRIWFEQGDLPQAQAALLRAIKLHPREKEGFRWLAQVLMKRGEPGRAVQVLERAIAIDPGDTQLQQARARAERLSKIARDADTSPVFTSPEEPRVARSQEPPRASSVEPARPRVSAPAPRPSLPDFPPPPAFGSASVPPALGSASAPPAGRSAPPRVPPPTPREPRKSVDPLPAVVTPRNAGAANDVRPASASRSAQPMVSAQVRGSAAPELPLETDRDTVPPRAGAQEALLAAFERDDEDELLEGMQVDDAPTRAFEMPQEVQDWLESERTGGVAPVPQTRGAQSAPPRRAEPARVEPARVEPPRVEPPRAEPPRGRESARAVELLADSARADVPRVEMPRVEMPRVEAPRAAEPPRPVAEIEPAPSVESDIETEVFDTPNTTDPEPPEAVLELLTRQGLFEQSADADAAWVAKRDADRPGNRIGRSLALGWVLALAAAGGGYYGFTRWVATRQADARTLIAQAVADARDGQYESLLSAERRLRKAHERDPKSLESIEVLLFVHATRALEDATGDVGYLRTTVAQAEQAKVSPALVAAGKALLAAYDRNLPAFQEQSDRALKLGPDDARTLYLVGRLFQRTGRVEARALLEKATSKDPSLSLAWLAQAEVARQEGEPTQANELLAKSLGDDKAQLRAELWSVVLATGTEPIASSESRLKALAPRIERGAASDKLLAGIARAGIALAKGDVEAARAAVKEAAKLSVQDPELTSLLGERAASVGEHELAYRAANAAMLAAPSVRRYRDALASVLLKRGDGRAVLAALDGIDDTGFWLLVTRARAALLTGSREALEGAKKSLSAYRASAEGQGDPDAGALLVRIDLKLGANPEALIAAARSLVQRAPGSAMTQLALGEVALAAGQGELALAALEKARKLAPEEADVYVLRGRAYRLVGKPKEAEQSLEKALTLSPSHAVARETLGGLLLDRGDYERALGLFQALKRDRNSLGAVFGIIEAHVGAGDLDEAQKELDALSAEHHALPAAQVLVAKLALEKHRANDAVRVLEPLVDDDAETRTADTLALYGDALYEADKVDSAAGAYEAALELDPGHPDALVGRAMAAVRAEKVSQAYELLEQAKIALQGRVRPPRVKANLLLAEAKADILKETYAKAKELLAAAVALPGVPTEAHFWYAETLAKTKTPGASERYSKYLELDPGGYYADRAKKALAPR